MTKYGWPQVFVFPLAIIILMIVCGLLLIAGAILYFIETVLVIVLIWVFSFFRDPARAVPTGKNLLLSPADGVIADIETVEENEFIDGPALRIGIFLSVFNVHINRSPCEATVEKIIYKKGKFKDARDRQAGKVNESNDIYLLRAENPHDRLIVRQISGAIARRIVCAAKQGQNLVGGEKFGMIKFGSRTELYLPKRDGVECAVNCGDKVKAGLSVLVKY